jgi:peptidoglycan hydrolase-like protein with peptidoglycan-binding domain
MAPRFRGGSGGGYSGTSGFRSQGGTWRSATKMRGAKPAASSRWRRGRHRRWGYGFQGANSPWAAGIQACLAQLVGPWVPQNGIVGPLTRRAVQMFQGQQQLPVTGLLDNATVTALQSACSGEPAGPPATPPPAIAAPSDAAAPPEASDSPTGAASPAAGSPADAGEAEVWTGELEEETGQELRVEGQCKVEIERHDPVPFAQDEHFRWAPDAPAVYITYIDGKPWRADIAEHNLRRHLLMRAKALKDLNIPLSSLQNRSVAWASLRAGVAPRCAIRRRSGSGPASSYRPVHARHGILKILKAYFVNKLQTSNKGNPRGETIRFGQNGSLAILDQGKQIAKLPTGNQV